MDQREGRRVTAIAATFEASRRELLGPGALLGAAEIARSTCRSARREVGLLAITRERMRRIDGWLDPDGLVVHPVAATPDQTVIGMVCNREHGAELAGSMIEALVGSVPSAAAAGHVDIGAIDGLSSSTLPPEVAWLFVVTDVSMRGIDRWVWADVDGGLVGSSLPDPTRSTRLEPVGPMPMWTRVAHALDDPGDGPRTA
jgi:hypothetical protein